MCIYVHLYTLNNTVPRSQAFWTKWHPVVGPHEVTVDHHMQLHSPLTDKVYTHRISCESPIKQCGLDKTVQFVGVNRLSASYDMTCHNMTLQVMT